MDLTEVAASVEGWLESGLRVGVGWPVAFAGFSSRSPGEVMAVTDTGLRAGEVVGPAVSELVGAELSRLVGSGAPWCRLVQLTVDDAAAAAAGLSCGGTVTVALHHGAGVPARFWRAVAAGQQAALVSWLPGEGAPDTAATLVEGEGEGGLGSSGLDERAAAEARGLQAEGGSGARVVSDGPGTMVVEAVAPAPRLVVVGAGTVADALVRQAGLLGWRPEVAPDRPSALDAIGRLGPGHGVVVLSHDADVGVPALAAALARQVTYVGALGSRRTQAARREQLLGRGVAGPAVDSIHGPAGLDLGGRAPGDMALAICAEMLAVRSGRRAGPLRDRDAPINS